MANGDVFPTFHAAARLLRRAWCLLRPVLAALFLLSLLAYVAGNVMAGRELERAIAGIRERNEPLTLAEIAPPPVPDAQNAALIYDQAFYRLPRLEYASLGDGQKAQRFSARDEKLLSNLLSDNPRKREPITMEQVRQALAGTDDALAVARRAAGMPHCRFPVNWEDGAGALFPHYSRLRSFTRLLGAHAIIAALDGEPAQAVADIQAIVGISRHTAAEPTLLGQVTAYASLAIAGNSLQQVLAITSLDAERSGELHQTLAQIDLSEPLRRALMGERAFGVSVFDLVRQDPERLRRTFAGDLSIPMWFVAGLQTVGLPLLKKDQIYYIQFMTRHVETAEQRGRVGRTDMSGGDVRVPWYAIFTRLLLPAVDTVRNKRDERIAALAVARWALALSVYRRQTGHYPPSLAEAEARSDWDLPRDPFAPGSYLRYRREGSGFLLYSIGDNGRDNNGENSRIPRVSSPPPPDADDIAWRVHK